ncbi:MAG TPA: orotate phosphoribosyltransferase [Gammaproteobacteria bacterium]|nr:orotate phosphoribosyltransferase [Gammaproteobacteria bacterium]
MLAEYQKNFIDFALNAGVLSFGEYTLKSGRTSPYFFNAGAFNSGQMLSRLGSFYAEALVASSMPFDVLFGPAYKGIPLVSATSTSLYDDYSIDVPYAFNRKEEKDHGEGGRLVGAEISGRVVIVDDVITAGTAIRETMSLLKGADAEVSGILVAIDRQEKGNGELSAIQEVEEEYGVRVSSIIKLDHIVEYLNGQKSYHEVLTLVDNYRTQYGIAAK